MNNTINKYFALLYWNLVSLFHTDCLVVLFPIPFQIFYLYHPSLKGVVVQRLTGPAGRTVGKKISNHEQASLFLCFCCFYFYDIIRFSLSIFLLLPCNSMYTYDFTYVFISRLGYVFILLAFSVLRHSMLLQKEDKGRVYRSAINHSIPMRRSVYNFGLQICILAFDLCEDQQGLSMTCGILIRKMDVLYLQIF